MIFTDSTSTVSASFYAVIVAGGTGRRFGTSTPKQFCILKKKSVLSWSVDVFLSFQECRQVIIVSHPDWIAETENTVSPANYRDRILIVPGGSSRQDSCYHGISAIEGDDQTPVLIHDAARPWVCPELVRNVFHMVSAGCDAVIPVVTPNDSIVIRNNNIVIDYPDRSTVGCVQTPQGFRLGVIRDAHRTARETGYRNCPDDGTLAVRSGYAVTTINGHPDNRKVTDPGDI